MKLAITGTPCTGKTTIAEKLHKRMGWKLVRVNDIAKELNAYLGEDKKRKSKILDMKRIRKYLKDNEGDVIIEGHAAHEIPYDIVIVLRCNPEVLEKRLEERYPDDPDKVKENVDAEILGIITSDATESNDNVYEVDTSSKSVEQNVDDIVKIVNNNVDDYEVGSVDWLEKYEEKLVR